VILPESHQDDEVMQELLTNEESDQDNNMNVPDKEVTDENEKKYAAWQIEYYQKYFNVNTTEVLKKITQSMIPTFNQNYLHNTIRPNPDLYGPFWITITLIFTIAISGNFVSFMQNFGSDFQWHTDFHKVTTSAVAIICYWWIMPVIIHFLLRWRQVEANEFSFIELLSIYGYSLFVYIPISVLWMINISFIQWLLVLAAVLLSGSVLFFTFWPAFKRDSSKPIAIGVMSLVILFHALLGLSFMLYFFHDPTKSVSPVITTTPIPVKEITKKVVKKLAQNVTGV